MSRAAGLGYKTSKPLPTTLPPVRLGFLKIPQLHPLLAVHSKNVTLTRLTGVRVTETTSGRYADIMSNLPAHSTRLGPQGHCRQVQQQCLAALVTPPWPGERPLPGLWPYTLPFAEEATEAAPVETPVG